jgi:hypothetical protein
MSDGGQGGYNGDVPQLLCEEAVIGTEVGSDEESSRRLVKDMQDRFALLEPSDEAMKGMTEIVGRCGQEDSTRQCVVSSPSHGLCREWMNS